MSRKNHSPKKSYTYIWVALAVVIIAGAIWYYVSTRPEQRVGVSLVQNAEYQVAVAIDKNIPLNKPVSITFSIQRDGKTIDSEAEGRALHAVLASPNFHDFIHAYPVESIGRGKFQLTHTFTQPGKHRVWTEIVNTNNAHELHHGQNADLVSYVDFEVEGSSALPSPWTFIRGKEVVVGDYKIELTYPQLRAGQQATIQTVVKNRAGAAMQLLEYEPSIYAMTGNNLDFFRHGHTNPPKNGTIIEIVDSFPAAGEYLYWTEIPIVEGDDVTYIDAPFILTVGP